MGDRVPIAAIPGLVDGHVATDFVVLPFGFVGTAVRLHVGVTDPPSGGSISLGIRNAAAGGGSAITATLVDSAQAVTATGTLNFTGSEIGYLWISAASGSAMNLYGWVEVETVGGVVAALTSLARVKEWLGKTGSEDDAILTNLISGQSARIQAYLHRYVIQQTITGEIHHGHGREKLVLDEWPVSAVSEVREDGDAIDAATYELDTAKGILYARQNGNASVWSKGSRNYAVDYTAGYATTPDDLVDAATKQVVYVFRQSQPGGNRLGERGAVLDPGGSAQYLTGPWATGVLETLKLHRELRIR